MKVALKDLELRGAGNMLGPEQHGSIAAVGFDMYVSMLDSAVKEMRGRAEIRKSEVKINLPVNALIPEDYIADEVLRIEAYRMLSEITNKSDAKNALATLEDRYGKPTKEVRELIKICVIKALAETAGIQKIIYAKNKISISPLNFDEDLTAETSKTVKVNYKQSEKAYELFPEKHDVLDVLNKFLKRISGF
jgi:transcription-repair coupling factor (superfamily II helicase)